MHIATEQSSIPRVSSWKNKLTVGNWFEPGVGLRAYLKDPHHRVICWYCGERYFLIRLGYGIENEGFQLCAPERLGEPRQLRGN